MSILHSAFCTLHSLQGVPSDTFFTEPPRFTWWIILYFFVGGISAVMSLAAVWWLGSTADAITLSMPSMVYVLGLSGAAHIINYYRDAVDHHGLAQVMRHAAQALRGVVVERPAAGTSGQLDQKRADLRLEPDRQHLVGPAWHDELAVEGGPAEVALQQVAEGDRLALVGQDLRRRRVDEMAVAVVAVDQWPGMAEGPDEADAAVRLG